MLLGSVGEKAEVTDAHEAVGQHMEEEATDELLGVERLGFQPIFVFSIPISEGDLTVFRAQDAVVGDSYSMGVAAQVIEDLLWGSEGFFRIDDPVCVAEPRSWGWEFALADGLLHQVEELTPEDSAQVLDPKQEVFAGGSPAALVERESACGDEAVQVEVVFKGLVPGVKYSDETYSSPQVRVAELQKRLTDRLKQDV